LAPRELLTGYMLEFITVCFRNIVPEHLDADHRDRYLSIKRQFEQDGCLSPSQCNVIKSYKLVNDYKIREAHLAEHQTFDKEILAYKSKRRSYIKTGKY
jgi:hypothetical protein